MSDAVPQPTTSSLNVRAGDTVANLVVVDTDADLGLVSFANAVGSTDLVIDIVGSFSADEGDRFHAIAPTRILDDRNGTARMLEHGTLFDVKFNERLDVAATRLCDPHRIESDGGR